MVIGLVAPEASVHGPPSLSWYWYPVIGDPPVVPGMKSTRTLPSAAVTDETEGAPGSAGVVAPAGAEATPGPAMFTARSCTEYACPAASPPTEIGLVVPVASAQSVPLNEYWYPVTAVPPEKPGVNAMLSEPLPTASEVIVGAPGTARGVPEAAAEIAPAPTALWARTSTEYAVPLTRPGMTRLGDAEFTVTHEPPSTR